MKTTDLLTQIQSRTQSVTTSKGSSRRKQIITTLLKAVVSIGLILWILRDTELSEILASIGSTNLLVLSLAFSLNLVGWLSTAYRWRALLAAQKVHASIAFLMNSCAVSVFFNNLLPSTIGGDAVRIYDSWRLGCSKAVAVTVIFADRFIGLIALMLFTLAALSLYGTVDQDAVTLWAAVLLGSGAMMVVIWLTLSPPPVLLSLLERVPLLQKFKRVMDAFATFRGEKRVLFKALLLSVVLQANVVIHYYVIGRALDLPIPLHAFFMFIPLTIFIMMVPISINAVGIRENVFVFFFALYGVSAPEAIAFAWISYAIVLIQGIIGGVVYALRTNRKEMEFSVNP
jgi:glycosyltransferase 2 family protein